jgi:SAM-dependent methyltransferase
MRVLDTLRPTRCAICDVEDDADVVYDSTINEASFTPELFSARRMPDGTHYRIVRCRRCGLVRSDPIAEPALLSALYADALFTYADEVPSVRETYGRYLRMLANVAPATGSLLEIGCGSGFALEEALAVGWRDIRGVEPTRAAIDAAAPLIRDRIVCDVMRPGLFEAESFDAICLFQTLDHIWDPQSLLKDCNHVLRPGGAILVLNHDIDAPSARLLGRRSPIIDIEHMYLYSRRTLSLLLEKLGFVIVHDGRVRNLYSIRYLTRLAPLPSKMKKPLLARLDRVPIGRWRLRVPLGNLFVIGQKPLGDA